MSLHSDHGQNQDGFAEKDPPLPQNSPDETFENNPFFANTDNSSTSKSLRLKNVLDHLNSKDLKELFKCSVALWIITVFIVIDPVLRAEGQALFFGCIVLLIVPPSGIVFLQLLISATMVLGMGIAWAWGVITMKAALAARPAADTNARLLELQQAVENNTSPPPSSWGSTTYSQVLVLNGFMLDARVTAVYYVMICVFIYFLSRVRAGNPKFVAVQIFGIVISDVFLTSGPLLPFFNGKVPQVLIKPAATAIGVGLVCNIFLFPESTSHIFLDNVKQVLTPMVAFVDACRISLDHSAAPMALPALRKAKAQGITAFKTLDARLAFLPLDISVCRWNTDDILLLKKPLRLVFITWAALIETQITRSVSIDRTAKFHDHEKERSENKVQFKIGHHQLSQQLDFAHLFRNTETEELIIKSMAALQQSAEPLLRACNAALEASVETITLVNGKKWYGRPSPDAYQAMHQRHEVVLKTLRAECDVFLATTSARILDPHAHLFNKDGILEPPPSLGVAPLRGVVLGLILEERIVSFARALVHLLAQIVALEEERTKQQLWLPKSLRNLGVWIFGNEEVPRVSAVIPEMEKETKKSQPRRRNAQKRSTTPGNNGEGDVPINPADQLAFIRLQRGKKRSRLGRAILFITHWFSNTAGIYALRVVIVTIALAIPAALPSSSGFYYREKGLWALIMGQLGLVPYAADFLWGVLSRVIGTILGGVLGMVAWYIGAGNGSGNPYGIAAIMAPLCIFFMYMRLFGSPALLQAVILTAVTAYLTVSYSWVDTHMRTYGHPGVGYAVFWRRTLLVLVGFAASAVVTYFPRPQSASRHYRRVLSRTVSSFEDRYALLIQEVTTNIQLDRSEKGPDGRPLQLRPLPTLRNIITSSPLLSTLEKDTITTADTLSSILGPIQLLKFEFSSTDFTADGLSRLTSLATNVNFDMFQLFYYTHQMPPAFKKRFLLLSGCFEERFVGDFMAVMSLLSHSLESGHALPSVLPAPLMVRAFRDRVLGVTGSGPGLMTAPGAGWNRQAATTWVKSDKGEQLQFNRLLGPITRQALEEDEEGFRKYCVVLSAMVGLLSAIDEMVHIVKEQLGETHIVDVEHWGAAALGSDDSVIDDDERAALLANGAAEHEEQEDKSKNSG
ncbi:hypothetical protein PV10_04121 [Exophiala mesophila]|uniref:ER transporter 6TM N-terminal domain-containing protein n=1 Tax=Exophiala mesophila TaxID=212818 RepID=A0A0D1ZDR8_EXOME|nr:uncharacterized protein PV10_04121 [Exophiala mesophila]KIV92857.1 hypothetical protein PV10_04121 [Exophiala mesophila]